MAVKNNKFINVVEGKSTLYRLFRFIDYENSNKVLSPIIDNDIIVDNIKEENINLSGLLYSLHSLYSDIKNSNSKDKVIYKWCVDNMHPYKITVLDKLLFSKNDMHPDGKKGFDKDIKDECKFSIDSFYKDLERIIVALIIVHGIKNALIEDKPNIIYDYVAENKELIKKYYGDFKELWIDNDMDSIHYKEKLENCKRTIINSIAFNAPELQIKIERDLKTKYMTYAPKCNSIFDICWYKLNKTIVDINNILYGNLPNAILNDEISMCPYCGIFYIKHHSRQITCGDKECTRLKINELRRDFYKIHKK